MVKSNLPLEQRQQLCVFWYGGLVISG